MFTLFLLSFALATLTNVVADFQTNKHVKSMQRLESNLKLGSIKNKSMRKYILQGMVEASNIREQLEPEKASLEHMGWGLRPDGKLINFRFEIEYSHREIESRMQKYISSLTGQPIVRRPNQSIREYVRDILRLCPPSKPYEAQLMKYVRTYERARYEASNFTHFEYLTWLEDFGNLTATLDMFCSSSGWRRRSSNKS